MVWYDVHQKRELMFYSENTERYDNTLLAGLQLRFGYA